MSIRNPLPRLLGAACLALGLVSAAFAQPTVALPQPALKRGVNVLGYDALWSDPAKARFQLRHMQAIRDGGFDHVRMNLHAFEHMDAEGRLSPAWLQTLDGMTAAALNAGLQVILDQHNFNDCAKEIDACRARLKAFWRQIAPRYKDAPDAVLFEILNEPNGAADAVWNDMLAENLAIIRETNPRRRVVVGPKFWNSLDQLETLKLPEADRNLVVTFHYYTPMEFTHQGASWTPQFQKLSGVTWGTAQELDKLKQDFDRVKAWSQRTGRPILLGEFGALESAGMAQRVAWTAAVARAAEARGFGWSYWQFDSDFVVWDMKADGWVKPILGALVPVPGAAPAVARSGDPALDHLINVAKISAWSVYGEGQSTQQVACEASGKACLRVDLQGKRANPWDNGVIAPITADIRKGDKLQVLVWMRLDTEDAKAKVNVPVSLQLNAAPYTALLSGAATLTSKLEPVVLNGTAQENYAAGSVMLSAHVGQVGQPIWVSAPFVLRNFTPGK
ncbi:endoglucanase [Pelomonas saccharophila]|uniref:Endoglucanase n=1 Tax=Roseateles saccharophilus TaxID=304 RepID=A0ABU1YQX7_ROSSA|nr:glycoside hydrolase family 5 protein [Roseateles saccharophilus]MDR7271268.1 endoglucanase [Roseateles saccharophilus]